MKKSYIIMMVCLLATFAPATAFAQIHTTNNATLHSYGGGSSTGGFQTASAPTASFRSTSTGIATSSAPAVGFSSISVKPALPSSGTQLNPYATGSEPRRARGDHIGTPGSDADNQLPLGDALLPLLMMLSGYVGWKRRKSAVFV